MDSIQFCDDCDNIMYKHINDDNKLFNVCKVCLNMKEIDLDNYIYENKKHIDSSEIINKNQFILNDNTLSTTTNPKNIICPNKDCETNTDKTELPVSNFATNSPKGFISTTSSVGTTTW